MRDNNKRKREEEPFLMQTLTESVNYQSETATATQNIQTPVIEQNPTYNQSVLINQPIIQNQQLLYQLQRTTDAQQNLVYLIVPSNENIQVQSVPLTVINDQQTAAHYLENAELSIQEDENPENAIILEDIKEEMVDVKEEFYSENNINSNQSKNVQYSYNVSRINPKNSTSNNYSNISNSSSSNSNYNQVYPKTNSSSSNKDSATASKAHMYRCDYKDCTETFCSLYEKKQHLDAHIFPENTEFKCSICNMIFEKSIDRNKHVESHAIPPTFKCKQCQKDFSYFTVLMKHLEEKKCSSKNPVFCYFCKAKIIDYDELVRHNHLNMKSCTCGVKVCGNQAYDLHINVCKLTKNKVQNTVDKKKLKTKKV